MRRIAALLLPCALLPSACPGTDSNYSQPKPDADIDPPDAAIDVEAGPPVSVKVLTWNVHNFYNDVRDSFEVAEADEVITPTAEYQQKLADVTTVIGSVGPDVIMMQEVENDAVIDDLAAKLSAAGVGEYPNRYITHGNDPRGIDIAVLARKQIGGQDVLLQIGPSHKQELFEASTNPGQKFVFARDVLEAHFSVNGRHLALLGIHFKAQDGDPTSDVKRLAEAEQTRRIAEGILVQDEKAAVVVLGDFNCTPGSPPFQALLDGVPPLTSAASNVGAADRYSVTFGGNPQLFDDQLGDPNATALLDPASVSIPHTGAVNTASDHDPVVVSYLVR
jgi:endonuclease/exonuclease/phosphatase family metal-dependent hydrolase